MFKAKYLEASKLDVNASERSVKKFPEFSIFLKQANKRTKQNHYGFRNPEEQHLPNDFAGVIVLKNITGCN